MGSNPILSVAAFAALKNCIAFCSGRYGEVPKLAEGTPLERVQVVNSGAGVQISPSPIESIFLDSSMTEPRQVPGEEDGS